MRNFFFLFFFPHSQEWIDSIITTLAGTMSAWWQTHLLPLDFRVRGRGFTSLCCRAERWPIQQRAGRISPIFFTPLFAFPLSLKTCRILLFSHFQPYPWPDLILFCWYRLYVCFQQTPRFQVIYLPGILKTDFTEPSTSRGYWGRVVGSTMKW